MLSEVCIEELCQLLQTLKAGPYKAFLISIVAVLAIYLLKQKYDSDSDWLDFQRKGIFRVKKHVDEISLQQAEPCIY